MFIELINSTMEFIREDDFILNNSNLAPGKPLKSPRGPSKSPRKRRSVGLNSARNVQSLIGNIVRDDFR